MLLASLNDIYHISMIVIGFGGLILAYLTFILRLKNRSQKYKKKSHR